MIEFESCHCTVVPIDLIRPEDEDVESPVFSIDFEVTYTSIPQAMELDVDEEDEDEELEDITDQLDYYTLNKTHVVQFDRLIGESSHVSTVWDILQDMNVPVQTHLISRIVSTARDMARDYKSRNVLRMSVIIDVMVDDDDVAEDDDDDDEDEDEDENGMVSYGYALGPASESSVEKHLETVEMDRVYGECAICKEEVEVGSKAGRMPCSHVFHRTCVVQWLERSGTCPLCRSKFPRTRINFL